MAQFFSIHPDNPQSRLLRQAADTVRAGGVIVYPTDSCYALGCQLGDKSAMARIRSIRGVNEQHHFSLACRSLSEISNYAKVSNSQYRLLKATTPGSYLYLRLLEKSLVVYSTLNEALLALESLIIPWFRSC